jgi:hypothetical protein
VVADPNKLGVDEPWVPAEGAVVVAAGLLLPKRLGVPVGVAVPDAGVEVLPNRDPAGLLAPPPNSDPPDDAPVVCVCPNIEVPVDGVVVLPAFPKRLPD